MRKMMTLLTLAALLLPACTRALPAPSPAPANTVEQDGVRVTLRMDRERYAPGETLWAEVRVENIGNQPVTWIGGGCNLPARLTARAPSLQGRGEEWPDQLGAFKRQALAGMPDLARIPFLEKSAFEARRAGRGVFCTAAVREVALAPGGVLEAKFAWDGALPLEGGPRAPSGWATFEAVFPMGHIAAPAPVTVRVQAAIEGGPQWLISPGEAVDAALGDARFSEQIAGHATPESTPGSVRFVGGQWQVTASERGLMALVDPVQGRVLSLKQP